MVIAEMIRLIIISLIWLCGNGQQLLTGSSDVAVSSATIAPWCPPGIHRHNSSAQTFICSDGVELHIDHICDGVEHCGNFNDENCLAMDMDETNNGTSGPVFMYLPRSDCRVALCYSDLVNPVDLHIMCRQLGYATFSAFTPISNDLSVPTILPEDLPCFGPERTVQECLQGVDITIRSNCAKLLRFSCIPACAHSITDLHGTVSSPGYPNFVFSNMDCFWDFSAPQGFVYTLTFYTVNLVLQTRNDNCRNTYLELYLGRSRTPGPSSFRYLKFCNASLLYKNLTAVEGNIWLRYVSGQNTGNPKGAKGFFFRYEAIPTEAEVVNDTVTVVGLNDHDYELPQYGIVLSSIAAAVMFIVICVVVYLCVRCKIRRKAEGIMLHHAQWMAEQGNQQRSDHQVTQEHRRLININLAETPVICANCATTANNIDSACSHLRPMWEWAIEVQAGNLPLPVIHRMWKDRQEEDLSTTVYEDIGDGNNNTLSRSSRSRLQDPKNRTYVSLSQLLESPIPLVKDDEGKTHLLMDGRREESGSGTKHLTASAAAALKRSPLVPPWRWNSTLVGQPTVKEMTSAATTLSANNLMAPMRDFLDSAGKKLRSISSWKSPSPGKTSTPTTVKETPHEDLKLMSPVGSRASLVVPSATPTFHGVRSGSQMKRFNTTPVIVIHPGSVKQPGTIGLLSSSPRKSAERFRFPPCGQALRSRSCPSRDNEESSPKGLTSRHPTPRKSSADSDTLTPVFCESWSPISPPTDLSNFHFQDSQVVTPAEAQSSGPAQSPSFKDIL